MSKSSCDIWALPRTLALHLEGLVGSNAVMISRKAVARFFSRRFKYASGMSRYLLFQSKKASCPTWPVRNRCRPDYLQQPLHNQVPGSVPILVSVGGWAYTLSAMRHRLGHECRIPVPRLA